MGGYSELTTEDLPTCLSLIAIVFVQRDSMPIREKETPRAEQDCPSRADIIVRSEQKNARGAN